MKKKTGLLLVVCFAVFAGMAFVLISCDELDEGGLPVCLSIEECLPLAEQGNAEAQYYLGIVYARGIPQDDKEAVKWYRKAAEQGYVLAQKEFGRVYYSGEGVSQDYKEAYAWLDISASQGLEVSPKFYEDTSKFRDKAAKELSPEALAEAKELSKEYYKLYVEPFQ